MMFQQHISHKVCMLRDISRAKYLTPEFEGSKYMKTLHFHYLQIALFIAIITLSSVLNTQITAAKQNIVIVIDPGHGGNSTEGEKDLGASYNGVFEKEIDLITANALCDELSQYPNLTVYMTRTEDVHMELQDRADFAESVGADMYISVHYNASAHHRFYGAEIFTSAYGEEYAKGFSLAKNIERYWKEAGSPSKGVRVRLGNHGDYYGVIRMCKQYGIPAMILEHGYLDNDRDFSRLGTREFWEYMGRLDGAAIADYYGLYKGIMSDSVKEELIVDPPADHIEEDTTPPENVTVSIDSYDPKTRELTYTISASDPESYLMYYGFDTTELAADEDNGFLNLELWDEGVSSMQGTCIVPEGYNGSFTARAYNNYEKYTDTEPVEIPQEMLEVEEPVEEAETVSENTDRIYDVSEVMDLSEDTYENDGNENPETADKTKNPDKLKSILIFAGASLLCFIIIAGFCIRIISRRK